MNFNELHFQKLVQALSLTLIHSLWQGLIVAALAGMILMLTKKAKPALRYNLLAALLFAFVIAAFYTFSSLLMRENGVAKVGVKDSSPVYYESFGTTAVSEDFSFVSKGNNAWIASFTDFCSSHAQMIVAVWFIIFAFKSFQATAGFLYLQKIKKRDTKPLRESWKPRFDLLARKLKISQAIQVIESEHVLVPMVIGFLKPMVIIPFGIFTNLPETQIEAIILHELAHIKRRDYVVNLIQIFCENVFFFNPALLWLSRLIREEREHCCDDLAISVMENKTSFVHALVSFQEYNLNGSAFKLAFSQKRNHLLDRIKRIIYNNNKPLNAMEKLFVTFSLLTAVALSAAIPQDVPKPAPSKVVKQQSKPAPIPKADPVPVFSAEPKVLAVVDLDTLPKKKKGIATEDADRAEVSTNTSVNTVIDTDTELNINTNGISTYRINTNGKDYDLVRVDGKIRVLKIDGKEIPEEQFPKYQEEIDEVLEKVKEEHIKAEVHRKEAEEHRAAADVMRKKADELRLEAHQNRLQADQIRVQANQNRLLAEEHRKEAEKMREEAEVHRARADKDRERFEGMQENIIDDLKESGAIKSKVGLSYKFNENELVINGEKQPDALHRKLREKYMKDKNFEMLYNYGDKSGSSTGIHYKK